MSSPAHPTQPYSPSLHAALPISSGERAVIVTTPQSAAGAQIAADADTVLRAGRGGRLTTLAGRGSLRQRAAGRSWRVSRSEEHTSELQSHSELVCRLLLEKKNKI